MASTRKSPLFLAGLLALCGSLALLAFGAASASARQLVTHTLSKTVETHELVEYPETQEFNSVAVDEHTGSVYVADRFPEITKFKADGSLGAWSAPGLHGASTIRVSPFFPGPTNPLTGAKVAVDNTNGPHQGRVFLIERGNQEEMIRAFEPNGEEVTEAADPGEHWPVSNDDVTPAQFGPFNLAVDESGNIWENEENGFFFWREFKANGERGTVVRSEVAGEGGWGLDSSEDVYLGNYYGTTKYKINGEVLYNLSNSSGDLAVDRSNGDVYVVNNASSIAQYDSEGNWINTISTGAGAYGGSRIAINAATDTLYWVDGAQLRILVPSSTKAIPDIATGQASNFQATSVEVHGTVDPESVSTKDCVFEYGTTEFEPSGSVTCDQGEVLSGGSQEVTATIHGLTAGTTYHYRLTVKNANGEVVGRSKQFVPSAIPSSKSAYITEVHADSARVHAQVSAGGAPANYAVEYGTQPCSSNACTSTADVEFGSGTGFVPVSTKLEGLEAGTTYYYRIVGSNQSGAYAAAEEGTFTTFHRVPFGDKCANSHVRQQTGSALLYDCRAYELVSAGNAGGYDVESNLSPGQEPLGGYPEADGRALYAVHSGAIPGAGNPANHGPDPYLATRGAEGWTTEYVGIPSDFRKESFASTLLEADPTLSTFAFGGSEICRPCFEDGTTNIPLRLTGGQIIEGMAGSEVEAAEPSGTVLEHFSADGKHFVFGTTAKLEPTANTGGTDTTIYERSLSEGGATEVISTLPDESTMHNGTGVAELGISADGSRAVVGEAIGAPDADGNQYYHLYMHLAGSAKSIDLTPGTTTGALFDGMTADGSMVYFTTVDALTTASDQDTDTSADIYRADISGMSATLTRVSIGAGAGNTDACEPPGGWNSVAGGNNCDTVAIAGGGGVASDSGTIYFVSPEKLDTSGPIQPQENQPNLYAATPGSPPRFVATVDTSIGKPPPPPPEHKLATKSLVSLPEYSAPSTLAVDQNTGEIYVGMAEAAEVNRWNPDGSASKFSSINSNSLPIEGWGFGEGQVAVDSSDSIFKGDLYVDSTSTASVQIFNHAGEQIGSLTGLPNACGVAVDQSNGDVYVDKQGGNVTRFRPKISFGGGQVKNTSYEPEEGAHLNGSGESCNIDVSTDGYLYSWPIYGEGQVLQYKTSEFSPATPSLTPTVFAEGNLGYTVASDPATGLVFVLEEYGAWCSVYTPQGEKVETFGKGDLSFTRGLAIDDKDSRVYISEIYGEHSGVVSFKSIPVPYEVIENPLVRHGVTQAAVHSYKDFEVTPSGEFAAFPTKMPLKSSFDNGGHSEVYRYDGGNQELACVSCNPSNAIAETDASLATKGLSLTDDGRVFFNTGDGIAARDLDNKVDAYEYGMNNQETEEAPELISTGTSPFNSSLLGVTADGTDAFFFTRDTLVPQDENGSLVKLYDARAGGGYPFTPEKVPCKASDECHGAGSQQPPPPEISTLKGAKGNETETEPQTKPVSCKHGFVRKHGKCVKRHGHHKKKKRHHRGRG